MGGGKGGMGELNFPEEVVMTPWELRRWKLNQLGGWDDTRWVITKLKNGLVSVRLNPNERVIPEEIKG